MRKYLNSKSGAFIPRVLLAGALCAAGVFLAVLSFAAPLAPSAGQWSIVNSPNGRPTPTDNFPSGVTCVSASECWAVGYYDNGSYQTLIERWDGTSWTVVPSPNTSPTQHNLLKSVACASASDCWAVGSYYDGTLYQTLIERWDGTSWTIVTSPNTSVTQYNYLFGVTCVSAANCWAVGSYFTDIAYQTLIEHWDGTAWTIVTSPNTGASQENTLNGVTCVSASDCWAVGFYVNGTTGIYQTLIERWNGTSWAVVSSPNTLILQDNRLYGVTCASASDCWTVGSYYNGSVQQTLIARWNGTSWAIVTSPNTLITQDNRVLSVTCASASNCWAVGSYNNGSVQQTLIARWNGTSWTIVTSPNNSTTQDNYLYGVTCVSASDCWAIGNHSAGTVVQTLIERWNGTSWTIVTSPNINAPQNNTLLGVTCVSASDCWAVASYYNGSVQQTLIERWDGTSWTIVTSPNTSPTQSNILYDVTCVSASDCWAIGYYLDSSAWQTLIERWNGTAWTIVTSPNTGVAESNFLTNVTCASPSDCWAVGFYDTGIAYQTLIERWNGTAWTIVTSPNTDAANENRLFAVACASASDCWAVGRYFNGTVLQTLIERWNGTAWTIVTSPNTSALQENYLYGVTCASPSDCWAVGSYGSGSGTGQSLIERWNGTSWAIISSPNPAAQFNYIFLRGVTCASAADCWAVGYYFADSAYRTLIERWDGTSWTIVTSPNTSATQYNFLIGVTCVSAADCWAVGYHYDDSGIIQTLTQHYTASLPPTPTSVVSRKTHGIAGDFDVDLPLTGNPGIECRNGQGPNSDAHQVVLTFTAPATVVSATCDGNPATTGTSGNDVIVNCSGVPNEKVMAVALTGVTVGASSGNVSVPMSVLTGDTTADGFVNSADISQTKSQSGAGLTNSNFRTDLTTDGFINSADISLVKSKSGTALP